MSTPAILLVEDDDDIRDAVQDALERRGFTIAAVEDGRAALDYLATRPLPGLILLDLTMPRMSGWEFLAAQAKDPAIAAIPVVVLSAVANVEQHPEPHGWAAVLSKPVSLEHLLTTVARFVAPSPA